MSENNENEKETRKMDENLRQNKSYFKRIVK